MAVVGKSGADAIFGALRKICGTIKKYRSKLESVIDLAVTAGVITSGDAAIAKAFIDTSSGLCTIFEKLAGFSSVFGV